LAYLVEFPVGGDDSVIVEMDEDQLAGFVPAAVRPGEAVAVASAELETAVDRLLPVLRAIGDRMKQLGPNEVTVAVGVKLTAEAGVILAKASGEANFTVTLKWQHASLT
jgi:hypothetical protein